MTVPDPDQLHPSTRPDLTNVVFLEKQITSPLIEVEDFTYFDDEGSGVPFEQSHVLYNNGPQRLRIADTVVGNDVWLGRDATVLPGSPSATAPSSARTASSPLACRPTGSSPATPPASSASASRRPTSPGF